ncbi:PREDICTED: ATP-binding cassette sub-family A member 10-like [Nanorana parkeri]|uniref:ATP-binding cassette sub-family A member 10-like n=1 Tax=Nanorana parkeri TaxID=125878 RepID=UPI000854C255|nr:PREDICTED: ATP-binding cassette sub-family A member 10-like [Nanorana parkeri]
MTGRTWREASLVQQTFALLQKNLLVQWRRPGHTVLEWLQHLALVFLLFIVMVIHDYPHPRTYVHSEVLGDLNGFSNKSFSVGYVPKSPAIRDIMQRVNRTTIIIPGISLHEFQNPSDLPNATEEQHETVSVDFENEFTYSIRYNLYRIPSPNELITDRGNCETSQYCRPMKYWSSGFISLQASIDSAIVERNTKQSLWDGMATTEVVKMKSVDFIEKTILYMGALTFYMSMCFVSLSYLMTLQITRERRKTRELMRMMGLKDLAFWLSWGLLYTVSALIIATLMALIATTYVFLESSFGIIFLLFCLYGVATVCFNCMLSTLLRKHRLAAILGFFITIFLSALGILPLMKILPKPLEVFLSIFHPFSFAVGITESIHMENDLQGAYFLDIGDDSFHMLSSAIYLALDSILYILLTLYFDKIIPDKHGVRHEPLFFLRPSFWSKKKKMSPIPLGEGENLGPTCGDYVEKVPAELLGKEAIRITNVKKKYSGKDKNTEALQGLDLDIYEGQITALLGHSGAGKTTLLNILSGMCGATGGSANIYDHPLSDLSLRQEIRRKIGFCPQFDVNFDLLTVKENLEVFAKIKGVHRSKVKSEVEKVLCDLDIDNIQDVRANKLSGGQRRKLTLAIALLGDPEVIFSSEPTAGLDPFSRHRVWSILKERKVGHVTLFSTQFMDEADILADRKAVLSNGRLKCVGSSFFLKRKWGIGYHLRIQMTPPCDTEAIASLIKHHISNAKLSTQNVEDVTFTLPFENMDAFPALFSDLDGHVGRDIASYGVSVTTLDDVFLKLEGEAEIEKGDYGVFSHEQNEDEDRDHFSSEPEDSTLLMSDSGTPTVSGMALWRQQVLAVARIRYLKLIHDMKVFRSILLLLVLFIIPLIVSAIIINIFESMHTWELTPNLYFRRSGDRPHKYFTNLLLVNNTGLPIENVVRGIMAQDITVDVVDGPYDENTTAYNGAIEVTGGNEGYGYKIIGNPRAHNILPVLINIISNAYMRIYNSTERIRVWAQTDYLHYSKFLVGIPWMIYASGLAPHFAMSSMQDMKIKARSQLRISGLFPSAYWCGQALVDIALYWLLLFLMVAILFSFNPSIRLPFSAAMLLIGEILGYGMAMVLYVYLIAFVFGKRKIHHDRWSFCFILTSFLWLFLSTSNIMFRAIEIEMNVIYLFLVPPSNLMMFMISLAFLHGPFPYFYPFVYGQLAISLLPLQPYVQVVIFWGLLWFLEWRIGSRSLKQDPVFRFTKREHPFTQNPEELDDADEEVLAEKERVNALKTTDRAEERPAILVDSLRKEFEEKSGTCGCIKKKKKRTAVSHTSFCVKKGEVLGLLGPNGAGKTTSVLILAGEMKPTAGQVVLGNAGDSRGTEESGSLGYCPQNNPLWPNLTVKEHLEIYAAVKGMKKEDANYAIKRVSEALEMKDHLNKPAKKLSAGVSRKVCFAISMLGNPTIALLDEPSTGLDPKGQQRLWRAIRAAFKNKERGAILTTHYMEEAEAVCDRVAIMVSGKLRCIGSIQHLKSKYGKGYLLEIKLKDTQLVDVIHQEVLRLFPQAARQDRFSSLLVYKIPMDNVRSLSQAFLQLENAKQAYDMEEYSFSQSTLEQVFLELAKEQEKEDFHLDSSFRWKQLKSEEI